MLGNSILRRVYFLHFRCNWMLVLTLKSQENLVVSTNEWDEGKMKQENKKVHLTKANDAEEIKRSQDKSESDI